MPTARTALDLREIIRRVYRREAERHQSAWRLACRFLAGATQDQIGRALTTPERSLLTAAGASGAPIHRVWEHETLYSTIRAGPLGSIVGDGWLERATKQVVEEESRELGRSPFKKTSWHIMGYAFHEAACRCAPGPWGRLTEIFDQPYGDEPFRKYCAWFLGEGKDSSCRDYDDMLPMFHEAFTKLSELDFASVLLAKLQGECLEECGGLFPELELETLAEREILLTLLNAGAISEATSISSDEIARRLSGGTTTDGSGVRRAGKRLRARGLVKSSRGAGAGRWLSEQGIRRATFLAQKNVSHI